MSDTDNPDNVSRPTGRFRIVGAQEAGEAVGRPPADDDDLFGSAEVIDGDDLFAGRPSRDPGDPNRFGRVPKIRLDGEDEDFNESYEDDDSLFDPPQSLRSDGHEQRFGARERAGLTSDDLGEGAGFFNRDRFGEGRLGSAEDDTAMPHWTAPATGQVPSALLDEGGQPTVSTSAPRWRDQSSDFDAEDFEDVADLGDDYGESVGSSDPVADFFSFDGMDETVEANRARLLDQPAAPIDRPALTGEIEGAGGHVAAGAAPPGGSRNVPLAVGVGVGLAVVAVLAFRAGPRVTMVLVALAALLGAVEFYAAARRGGHRPATLVGVTASVALPVATYWKGLEAFPLVLGLTVMFGLLWYLIGVEFERPTPGLGVTMLGVSYVGGLISFAALILREPANTDLLLAAVIVTVGYDVGAFFVGRNAGRSPLSSASPNKTVEGLLGGCFTAILASVLLVSDLVIGDGIAPFGAFADALVLGVAAAVLAPLGDLAESLVKRDLGVKDMGTLLPGHGGVLDRFDGLMFVLPAVFYLSRLVG